MMRLTLSALAFATTASAALAQDPLLEVTNWRGVISTATHPVTGTPYPHAPTTPPGYIGSGVAPETRCWTYTPKLRYTAGHVNGPSGPYFTIKGMTQVIRPGAGTQGNFSMHYQFKTGIAPSTPVTAAHGREHAPTGNDLVSFPHGTVMITSNSSFRHNFTLMTPVPVNHDELCLFVEYRGGEQQDDPLNGQTLRADWQGGNGEPGGTYYGFTVGAAGSTRTVTLTTDRVFRGQIGMLLDDPVFYATGYHANLFDTNPLANETYEGLTASYPNYVQGGGTPNHNLFFGLSAGGAFATGQAYILSNWNTFSFPGQVLTPFGWLLLNPTDPLFGGFTAAPIVLDPQGEYRDGPNNPVQVPQLPVGTIGTFLDMQAAVYDGATTIRFTNRSSFMIR